MTYKTILVHLADDPDHLARLNAAIALADRFGAHLTAVYVHTPLTMPAAMAGRGASMGFQHAASSAARKHAEKVEREFRDRAEHTGLAVEWRMGSGEHAEAVAEHSYTAELTIVSQLNHDAARRRLAIPFPDDVPLTVPCPVLLLPVGWAGGPIGQRRIVVAWKPGVHASRAVYGAMPFLTEAAEVTILCLHPDEGEKVLYGTELANMLGRHGAKVEVVDDECRDSEVGDGVLDHCHAADADLLVMGAYGHSRLREVVIGSTTRDVCAHARLPVLMAH